MEVAIFSEGDADEAGLRALVDSILGQPTTPTLVPFQTRGWPAVAEQLPAVIRATYLKTDAVGLVAVADGNGSSLVPDDPTNRVERLKAIVARCRPHGRSDRPPLRIAIGVAYPCIEAWWLAVEVPEANEQSWQLRREPGRQFCTQAELKRRLYGTEFPGTTLSTERMRAGAERAAGSLVTVEAKFPYGFSPLVQALKSWR